jgi:hypothetical protein
MRAILKSLQHVIDASDCPTFSRKKVVSEYLDIDAICWLLDFLGISVLFTQTPKSKHERPPLGGLPKLP